MSYIVALTHTQFGLVLEYLARMTIKDIAIEAGVSIGTVDRVLHRRGRVAEATRDRVLAIVRESGYRTNVLASRLSQKTQAVRFAVLMPRPRQDSGYWGIVKRGIMKAAAEMSSFEVAVVFYHFDRYSERSFECAYLKMQADSVCGWLVAPVLPGIANRCFRQWPPRVPYAFFDTHLPQSRPLGTVGQNARQSGRLAGHLMSLVVPEKCTVCVVRMLPTDIHIDARIAGFKEYLSSHRALRVGVYEIPGNAGDEQLLELCRQMHAECGELAGVFVSNANTHRMADVLAATAVDCGVHVIGYDLVTGNRQGLRNGHITFLISQNPEGQGYRGLHILYRNLVLRQLDAQHIQMPLDIISRENLDGREW